VPVKQKAFKSEKKNSEKVAISGTVSIEIITVMRMQFHFSDRNNRPHFILITIIEFYQHGNYIINQPVNFDIFEMSVRNTQKRVESHQTVFGKSEDSFLFFCVSR